MISSDPRTDENNLLSKGQFAVSDIYMDSPEAVKEAIEELDMRPGNPGVPDDWIKGYHFTIAGYLTDPNSFENCNMNHKRNVACRRPVHQVETVANSTNVPYVIPVYS